MSFMGDKKGAMFETFPFPEELRTAEKTMNRDEGDEGDEKQKQASFSLSPASPSNNLFSVSVRLNEARGVL